MRPQIRHGNIVQVCVALRPTHARTLLMRYNRVCTTQKLYILPHPQHRPAVRHWQPGVRADFIFTRIERKSRHLHFRSRSANNQPASQQSPCVCAVSGRTERAGAFICMCAAYWRAHKIKSMRRARARMFAKISNE